MVLRAALAILALAVLSPVFYERTQTLSLFWKNAPGRLERIDNFGSHEIKFADRIRSCEDALLVESEGVAILACDPGREKWNTVMGVFLPGPVPSGELYIYDYKDAKASDTESLKRLEFVDFEVQDDFHTLGIAYDEATSTLFAASHRHDQPAIEVFKLDLKAYTAKHLGSIQHPLIHGPNSIALINSHELYVTNTNYFLVKDHPILNKVETYLGLPIASVVHVDFSAFLENPSNPVQANTVARLAFANGIEILNETTVVVASTSRAAIHFYTATKSDDGDGDGGETRTLTHASQLRVPFLVDNLSVAGDGALLIAGHPHLPSLGRFAHSRHVCNSPEELAAADPATREGCAAAASPSWVAEWTEAGGLRHLYADTEYPSSATAARDAARKVGIVSGLYAKGILVWRE
ncbi:putative paraoxonase [Biscogniauxia marginata]|nr:putative paraoxonase [Biscogniauxia marginata]